MDTKRRCVMVLLFVLMAAGVHAQQAASVPYYCDFENPAENARWIMANSATNAWYIDTGAYRSATHGLYVSCNNGIQPYYMLSDSSNSYAYRKIHFTAGVYSISFDWSFYGPGSNYIRYAYMRAFLIPDTATFAAGRRYHGLKASHMPRAAIPIDLSGMQPIFRSNWSTLTNPLVQVPNTGDYYLVFFFNSVDIMLNGQMTGMSPIVDNINITSVPCPPPQALARTDLGGGCIKLQWDDVQIPRPTSWVIEYGHQGFVPGSGRQRITTTNPDTICGLVRDSIYDFYVRTICPDSSLGQPSSVLRIRYRETIPLCMDFSDLKDSNTICTYGQYEEYRDTLGEFYGPYSDTGAINYGYQNFGDSNNLFGGSRHTVHTDPTELDSCSGRLLPTIPSGANYSVRLGCVYGRWICQSISYKITVDTSIADLLMLKYACVLYNPQNHTSNRRPRFLMELLDNQGSLIDSSCSYADLTAIDIGNDTTWHSGVEPATLWKEWTSMGVNTAAYHGQTITLRLTVYACGQGADAHYGYIYYTLNCEKACIQASNCASMPNPTSGMFTAPDGFVYNWYSPAKPNFSSSDRSIVVPLDSTTYYCHITFKNNSNCGFTLQVVACHENLEGRFPHAQFLCTKDTSNCKFGLDLCNLSHTSNANYSNIRYDCNYFFWNFGDGTTSNLENPQQHVYPTHGTYTIMLIAGNSDLDCYDTLYQTVTYNAPVVPTLTADTLVCKWQYATLRVDGNNSVAYLWDNGDTTPSTQYMITGNTTVQVIVLSQMDCYDTIYKFIRMDTVPLPVFDSAQFESCVPLLLRVKDIGGLASGNRYIWDWGDGIRTETDADSIYYEFKEPGSNEIKLYITSPNGCLDTMTFIANVYDYTKAAMSWQPVFDRVYRSQVHMINLSSPHDPLQNHYQWEFYNDSAGTTAPTTYNEFEPTHSWPPQGNEGVGFYMVQLIAYTDIQTAYGDITCSDTAKHPIYLLNDILQFPNVITPNGDGVNDIFEIKNLLEGGGYTDNELYIYNHWGRLVYYKKNISIREDFWDPTATNDLEGAYYYRFSAKGYFGNIQRNGVIQVIR